MSQNEKSPNRSRKNPELRIEICVKNNQPELLQGLDRWLQLNLISETQVLAICRRNLSCNLPIVKKEQKIPVAWQDKPNTEAQTLIKVPSVTNFVGQLWQGFIDELSIRWLLFLGIFLVVISSGVLAASKWDDFPQLGQYLILFVYTISFWGIGFWSNKQANLKLTSQTLQAIAVALIPINFWAINKFALGNDVLEWIAIIVALVSLSATVYLQPYFRKQSYGIFFITLFLFFSYVHLGWHFSWLPELAIYSGIIAIIVFHYRILLPKEKYATSNLVFLLALWLLLLVRELLIGNGDLIANYTLAIALFAWFLGTLSLTNAQKQKSFLYKDNSKKLVNKKTNYPSAFLFGSSFFLFLGTWFISLIESLTNVGIFFADTQSVGIVAIHIIINLLIVQLLIQSLRVYWQKSDLTYLFWLGLYILYISKQLIPSSWRTNALDIAANVSNNSYFPESVLGVTLFPYLIFFMGIATYFYRRQKQSLARHAEFLTGFLGIILMALSFSNPTWRTLNLLLSTITLGYVVKLRQPLRTLSIYLTHLLGLATIISGIAATFTDLSLAIWGSILALLTIGEWLVYLSLLKQPKVKLKQFSDREKGIDKGSSSFIQSLTKPQLASTNSNYWFIFKQSCWYFGSILSAISYSFLQTQITVSPDASFWGLVWLVTPAMLTLIAKYTRKMQQRRLLTFLSCAALVATQLLLFKQFETRFIGLSFAIGLMVVNAFNLRRIAITIIHFGFGLSLIASVLYSRVTGWNWLIVIALSVVGLYGFRQYLHNTITIPRLSYISQRIGYGRLGVGTEPKNWKLIRKYSKAADYWALGLTFALICLLSIIYLDFSRFDNYPQYLLSTSLILGATMQRYRKQPQNLVLYGVAWLIELLSVGIIAALGENNLTIAIANIVLGLFTLGLIQWLKKKDSPWVKLNIAYIPLAYGFLGILWRLSQYNAYSGLLSLGIAFIFINSQLANRQLNRLTNYLGFAGISLGIYEIVIYQMQKSSGGHVADGLTILALVAAAIAFSYRLVAWLHRQRHHSTIFNLKLSQVILIAHIHWAISSILKIIAASIALENATPRLIPVSIATSFCLGAYAIIQGKDNALSSKTPQNSAQTNSTSTSDWWVYVGLVEIVATLAYSRLIITRLSLFDPWRVILTCIIALAIYQIPWNNFGWRSAPWRRTAVTIPALMTVVAAENVSYLSLLATTIFYLRIAYSQKNIRWSYLSLGFLNWGIIRLIWQYNTEFIWLASILSFSILYIAQLDPYFKSHPRQRHRIRLLGSSILCVTALFYQNTGLIPSIISLGLIFSGIGLKVRAFMFAGTITLVLTAIYQLIILVLAYSFLKWIVGFLAGICLIAIAASFEKQKSQFSDRFKSYTNKLRDWQ